MDELINCFGYKIIDIESLKVVVKRTLESLSQNVINKAIDQWYLRLNLFI